MSHLTDIESDDYWKKVDDAIEQRKLDEFHKADDDVESTGVA